MKNVLLAGFVAIATLFGSVSIASASAEDFLLGGVYEDRFVHTLIVSMLNGYVNPSVHEKNALGEMFYSDAPETADVKAFLAAFREQTTSSVVYADRILLAFEYLDYDMK